MKNWSCIQGSNSIIVQAKPGTLDISISTPSGIASFAVADEASIKQLFQTVNGARRTPALVGSENVEGAD